MFFKMSRLFLSRGVRELTWGFCGGAPRKKTPKVRKRKGPCPAQKKKKTQKRKKKDTKRKKKSKKVKKRNPNEASRAGLTAHGRERRVLALRVHGQDPPVCAHDAAARV
jgi:hypothetical protein